MPRPHPPEFRRRAVELANQRDEGQSAPAGGQDGGRRRYLRLVSAQLDLESYGLKSAPEYVVRKGNDLFVRCYDTDYVFGVNVDRF